MDQQSATGALKDTFRQLREQEAEDDIVCRFGPAYFRGARFGAGCGVVTAASFSFFAYRFLKHDQATADRAAGFPAGVRHPDFPRSVLLRGLRTQPMLTLGCLCLQVTCVLKAIKFSLAHRRCVEFDMDDVGFELLELMAEESKEVPVMLQEMRHSLSVPKEKETNLLEDFRRAKLAGQRWSLLSATRSVKPTISSYQRHPTFMDGVAVGLAGSVFDCYLPQKPPSCYYNMLFGYGM
eukprot:gene5021-3616_t